MRLPLVKDVSGRATNKPNQFHSMQIFISWSGEKSKQIAEAFRHWLPDVIQSVRPYFTPDDIAKGQRWAADIADNLHNSQFGLFFLTAENLTAPWLLFEAGAVSKDSRNGKVCPLLFGVESTQLAGPLLQFQATPYSRDEVFKFMKAVNAETNDPLNEVQLARAFDRCWEELDDKVQAVLSAEVRDQRPPQRTLADMVEETLGIVRNMSLNPNPASDDDSLNHWFVLFQSTLEYSRDTLQIAENADQSAVLDQLRRLRSYLKLVANLIIPKVKSSAVGVSYTAQVTKILKQIEIRIEQLALILGDDGL
ncbi:MAG: toll/interleukin-1 receptor domain-containing protein [Burkholderiaceae bacterium]|nr:toll/interleukin-1 receptor domain-containing protein [Burkholderiaceae bacterium]